MLGLSNDIMLGLAFGIFIGLMIGNKPFRTKVMLLFNGLIKSGTSKPPKKKG